MARATLGARSAAVDLPDEGAVASEEDPPGRHSRAEIDEPAHRALRADGSATRFVVAVLEETTKPSSASLGATGRPAYGAHDRGETGRGDSRESSGKTARARTVQLLRPVPRSSARYG